MDIRNSNSTCSSVSKTLCQLKQQIKQKKKKQQYPQKSAIVVAPSMKTEKNRCETNTKTKKKTTTYSMKKEEKGSAKTTSPTKEEEMEMAPPSPRRTRSDNTKKGRVGLSYSGVVSNKGEGQFWSPEEEIVLLREVLDRSRGKLGCRGVYEQARNCLKGKYTNKQLYRKMYRLRDKFHATNVKKQKNKKFQFKNTHDESMYKLSSELWGSRDKKELDEEVEEHNEMPHNEEERQEEEHQEEGGGGEEEVVMEKLGVSPELGDDLMKVVKDVLERWLGRKADNNIDVKVKSLCKDVLNKACSSGNWPPLRDSNAELLERMWRQQQVLELQTCEKRLDLLKEECRMRLEELSAPD